MKSCLRNNLQNTDSQVRSNIAQLLAVCIKNTLLLSFGMTVGFPTILIPGLQEQGNGDSFNLSREAISWIGSIHLICHPIGCVISGAVTEYLGRKKCMQLVNIPFLCAWIMLKFASSIYLVYIALSIIGLFGGLLEAPVITYVAEICQPRLRGMFSSTSALAAIGGVLLQFFFGTFLHWRTVALVNCIFPILSFVLLSFVPESPHWLILKNRLLDARKSIAWLRGWVTLEEIEPEFKELCRYLASRNNIDNNTTPNETKTKTLPIIETIKLYTKKNFLWPYAIVTFCFLLSNFSGLSTLQTYAVQIFASLRAPIDKYVATVYLGIAEIIGCLCSVFVIRKLGKRKSNFLSLIGLGLCFVLVATYAYLIDVKELINLQQNNSNITIIRTELISSKTYSWVPLTLLVLCGFVAYMGIRILPWTLTGELYSNETRAAGSGLSGGIGYILAFLANKTFLSLTDALTLPGIFWFNSAVAFVGCALLYVILPETEGKPLYEITDHFDGLERLSNSVRRKDKTIQTGQINEGYRLDTVNKEANMTSHM